MIPTFSLRIIFKNSRSKFFHEALKEAREFDNFTRENEINTVSITDFELYEKWEHFNLLFWKTVDWKGSILEYEGNKYQGHSDKTRIFYALQFAHSSYMSELTWKIKEDALKYIQDVRIWSLTTMCN